MFTSQREEKTLRPADITPDDDIVPPFNSYSPPGDVTSEKMYYVNYGLEEDFFWLQNNKSINFTDSVVIARYGKAFRANKVSLLHCQLYINNFICTRLLRPLLYSPTAMSKRKRINIKVSYKVLWHILTLAIVRWLEYKYQSNKMDCLLVSAKVVNLVNQPSKTNQSQNIVYRDPVTWLTTMYVAFRVHLPLTHKYTSTQPN